MAIVSGYQKMKDYIKQSSGYKLLSRWANANTVECDDAQTVQSKIGGITGISSSLTANSSTQAASTQLTNQLYQNMNQLSSELGGLSFGQDAEGNWGYKPEGADAVIPFRNIIVRASTSYLTSTYEGHVRVQIRVSVYDGETLLVTDTIFDGHVMGSGSGPTTETIYP